MTASSDRSLHRTLINIAPVSPALGSDAFFDLF